MNKILIFLLGITIWGCVNPKNTKTDKKDIRTKAVTVPSFNADSAYAYTAKQVKFGPRVPGTKAHDACARWLIDKLTEFSDTVYVQKFKARTYDNVVRKGVNIIGSFHPEYQNRILLMAHWDSRPFADHDKDPSKHRTPIDAANDGASGVAVLLETARQFHLHHPDVGVDILLFDLEDWGPPSDLNITGENYWGLGSQYWSKNPHVPGYTATFGILLDMVGAKDATFLKEYFSRQYARYYLDMVWNKAFGLGYDNYFVDQDGYPIDDDHKFVNEIAKIPSIDIIHLDTKSSNGTFYEYWHTTGDTLDKIDKNTLKAVGQVLLTVVYQFQ